MASLIELSSDTYTKLYAHLLQDGVENVAFMFARPSVGDDRVVFREGGLYLVQSHEFAFQSDYHVSLTDQCLARVIKKAWDLQASLVDFHSHPSSNQMAQFSPSDLYGLQEFVPHIHWRLQGRPFAAVVVAPSGFDALVWADGPSAPGHLDALVVDGYPQIPTGLTIEKLRRRPCSTVGLIDKYSCSA